QTKLNLASETSESETSQDTGIRRLESNRPPLRVVRASDEVAAVHEARLDLVQKKGGACLWRQ
ncbi:DNA polymerase III subunit epsilon, partial [Aeromonas sp. CPF2-S1]|nr:DNA polymerase III subunit epsilon [Aeromonas sp. CPF2-S1]